MFLACEGPMDFTISPDFAALRDRISDFVETQILPVEADRSAWDAHENIGHEALTRLQPRHSKAC